MVQDTKEKLPHQVSASLEQKIHGIREIIYAFVFLGMAWFELRGIWAWVLAVIILIEVLLTAWDFVVEDRTRVLSPSERITHLVLSMNGGAYVALLIPVLWQWSQLPTGLYTVDYATHSLFLSLLGIGVLLWGIRDMIAGYQLQANSS